MTPFQQRFVAGLCMGGIGLIVGVSVFRAPRVGAAPFTSNFDDLIADLQSRATVLSNSTGKVQQQQFKTIEKVLKTLDGKNSTSLATDIQNLGNVSKTLIKAFPTDYTPPGSSLLTNTDTALDGLLNDVQATINTTQSNADLLATSTCKTKAQSSINTAQSQLDAASSATDIPTAAKLLGTALKTELKAEKAVAKCPLGGTGGGGTNTNDFVEATITGDFANSFRSSLLPPVATVGDLGVLVTIGAGEPDFGGTAMSIEVRNVTTTNTYPIDLSSDLHRNTPSNTFYVTEGEITFSTFDLTNRLLAGTFDYTATNSVQGGMITVTNGVFHFDKIQFVGGTP